ncbi:MAG: T9SS type A sorting domain-containing protein, partial [Bacteroidota bacterium]
AFLLFRNEGAEQVMLKVIDIHGREVIQQMTTGDRFELQRGKLAAGVYSYVIMWSSSDRSYSGRIVMD